MQVYLKDSKTKATKEQIKTWLYAGLGARFLDVIRWRLDPSEKRADTKENCRKYLAYEFKTYRKLLS